MQRRDFLKLCALGSASLAAFPLRATPQNLHRPTRLAFVADEFSYFITVVDIETGENLAALNFGIRPHIMEMARDDSMLAVASPEAAVLVLHDTQSRQTQYLNLPAPVYQMFFIPQSSLLAIGLRDRVGMVDYRRGTVHIFPKRFDSSRRDGHLNSYYSLLFSSFSQSFWVLDEERPHIHHRRGAAPESAWRLIDLSDRIEGGLGIGVASPEDDVLAFTTDRGTAGYLYFPQRDELRSTGELPRVGSTNEPMIAPYIDAYAHNVLFADLSGQVAHFDLRENRPAKRFQLDFSPRFIRTGWLEKTWMMGGDRGLYLQDFADARSARLYEFPYAITNMWVTGDSKTLLYTIDEQAPHILRLDVRSKSHKTPIRLRNVVMGGKIRMGSNNSICY